MKYFFIEPEVAGGLGERTVMDGSVHPPVITKLHYHFDDWLGDPILESFPAYIVTDEARRRLEEMRATGIRFDHVEVTTSDQFEELYPADQLPTFHWLRVVGEAEKEDFGISSDGRLIISKRVLDVLRQLGLEQALITER